MASSFLKTKKDKNIFIAAVGALVLIIAVVAGLLVWMTTDSGKEATQTVGQQYRKVEVPSDSRDLTKVPTPPVNVVDSEDDPYVGVDMEGRKIDIPSAVTIENEPKDQNTNKPAPRTVEKPNARDMRQVSNIGFKFNAPSVGLNDVTLGAIDEVKVDGGGTLIEPTNFTSVFTVRNRGVGENLTRDAASKGTLYLATHATDLGAVAPGNFLVDNETRQNKLKEGDTFSVTGKNGEVLTYRVTSFRRDGKDLIAGDKEIWNNTPGKAVIITCYPNSADNAVFVAELV